MIIPLFVISLVICQVQSQEIPCPSPSENCDCSNADDGDVICSGMTDIPSNLPTTTTFLDLDSNNLGSILLQYKMSYLNNLSLEQLHLSGTGLEAIENGSFSNQPNLQVLDLSSNNLNQLDNTVFYGLVKLKTLFLTKTALHVIYSTMFTYTPSLTFLDLDGNKLTTITNEFSTLVNLEVLLMSSNQIETMNIDALENQQHLLRLDLYDNKLTTPKIEWIKQLVDNNGTLKLNANEKPMNPWKCCAGDAVDFAEFIKNVSTDYVSYGQLNIKCSWPDQYAGRKIRNLTSEELNETPCDNSTTPFTTVFPTSTPAKAAEKNFTVETNLTVNKAEIRGVNFQASTVLEIEEKETNNFLHNLSDIHIALILLSVGALTTLVTAFIVIKFNARHRKKAFESFLQNLPNSKDTDSEDKVTTRTYRQDVPVYGSTGNIVDRYRGGYNGTSSLSTDDTHSDGSEISVPTQKRKPPPYVPQIDNDGDLSSLQRNNSSSVIPMKIEKQRARSGAFANFGYDTDQSDDDLWDISTIR